MAGLLDSINPLSVNMPKRGTTPLDQGTNQLINQNIARAQRPTKDFANESLAGVDQAALGAAQPEQLANQEAMRHGYSDGTLNGAISNHYNAIAGEDVKRLKDAYSQDAILRKHQALNQAAAMATARQNVTIGSYERLMQAYNQAEQARAQVLSSVLGAGGMLAGAYYGGRGKTAVKPIAAAGAGQTVASSIGYGQDQEFDPLGRA